MKYKLSFVFVFLAVFSFGQEPSTEEIRLVANLFLKNLETQQCAHLKKAVPFDIESIQKVEVEGSEDFNVVELSSGGFLVLTNDKTIKPVIAYSLSTAFNYSNDPDNILMQLIRSDVYNRKLFQEDLSDQWNRSEYEIIESEKFQQWPEVGNTFTGGWIETTWHQGHPYNSLFPLDPVTNERVVTGCVTTAFSQILNYHKTSGTHDLNSYFQYTSRGLNNATIRIDQDHQTADFPSFYELNEILARIREKYRLENELTATDISALNFLAAIMVKANFTSSSTSANIGLIPERLKDFFHYGSCEISSLFNSEVHSALVSNMRVAMPALLSIQRDEGYGHLIICDGYNTNDFFHLNFGWGENSPESISEVWYNIPYNIPAEYTLVNSIIYDIDPRDNPIHVSESLIELFPISSLTTASFNISSMVDANIELACNNFQLSTDKVNFSNKLDQISLLSGVQTTIYVRYDPSDLFVTDHISISRNDTIFKWVEVRGYESGNIVESGSVGGIWDDQMKPYLVSGEIIIDGGSKLEIAEGVKVYFLQGSGLIINKNGSLSVNGSAAKPVIFTSLTEENSWNGIDFVNSINDNNIRHAIIINSSTSGIHALNSDISLVNCLLANNSSDLGGGLSLVNSLASIKGCIIVNNYNNSWEESYGGGIYSENAEAEIINSTISYNRNLVGGGIYGRDSRLSIVNTILWENLSYSYEGSGSSTTFLHKDLAFEIPSTQIKVSHCIIQNLESLGHIKSQYNLLSLVESENVSDYNPVFVNPSKRTGYILNPLNYDWRITRSSGGINNGLHADSLALPTVDFYGNPRIFLDEVDIGAAECIDSANYLSVTPIAHLCFPPTMVDTFSCKTLLLRNTGVDRILLSTNSTDKNLFQPEPSLDQTELEPGDSIKVRITYFPSKHTQQDTGYFIVFTTADNYTYKRIMLTGTSVEGTFVKGPLSGTWTKDEGPYVLNGDAWVIPDECLEIKSGVEVVAVGNYGLEVEDNACLVIAGIRGDSVHFRGLGKWKGISFNHCTGLQRIDHASISDVTLTPAININSSPVRIRNSVFRDNNDAIHISNNSTDGMLYDIGSNTFFDHANICIRYERNEGQGHKDTLLITENIFKKNTGSHIICTRFKSPLKMLIDDNSFIENDVVECIIDHHFNSEIVIDHRNSITGNILFNNQSQGILGISSRNDRISINHNLIVKNQSLNQWSDILYLEGFDIELLNNTIAYNGNSGYTLNSYFYNPHLESDVNRILIRNNIFYGNEVSEFNFNGSLKNLTLDFNLLENLYDGSDNNIKADPGFTPPSNNETSLTAFEISDWYLPKNSPCIDAGCPEIAFNDKADTANLANALFPSKGTVTSDIGVFGGNHYNAFSTESVTICEGSDYISYIREGIYYRILSARNGRDSIIILNLDVLESELEFTDPTPKNGALVPGGWIDFSWNCSPPCGDSIQFNVYYSRDGEYWNTLYSGYDEHAEAYFNEKQYSGQLVYWYVIHHSTQCPERSPEWQFSFDMITDMDAYAGDLQDPSVFPNPSSGKFLVHFQKKIMTEMKLILYNARGQRIKEFFISPSATPGDIPMNISTFEPGTYYLMEQGALRRLIEKIIIQ